MIIEDPLEQLAIQWFQDTGWNYVHGAVIAPEGVAAEREDFRAVVLKGRLAEAVRRLNPKLPESAVEEVVHVVTKPSGKPPGEAGHQPRGVVVYRLSVVAAALPG